MTHLEVHMRDTGKPGFVALHPDPAFNFFMNRMVGANDPDELISVGRRIATSEDWIREMTASAEQAEADGRLLSAAGYWRAVEFYTPSTGPRKAEAYERFIDLHDRALPHVAALRTSVPFAGRRLPVIDVPHTGDLRGTIVMHSGFDGASEETFSSAAPLAAAGYRVVVFDGPGQGNALRREGLHMTYDWERPVGAVLDHFELDDCTLIGLSLGGYLAPRAAAFDKRIQRVVAWGAMYDFTGPFREGLGDERFDALMQLVEQGERAEVNEAVDFMMAVSSQARWAVEHGRHVSGSADGFEYFRWLSEMNLREVSDRITQDLLIVMGAADHLVPVSQAFEQAAAATNARSVTLRVMTAAEQASEHCQVGNPMLVVDEIIRWLDGLDRRDARLADCRSNLVSDITESASP